MKIIIIGAGLSGLSTAIALHKYLNPILNSRLTIKIYEKEPQFDSSSATTAEDQHKQRLAKLGAGLGLQSNGLNVLGELDPTLKQRVYEAGYPCDHFKWLSAGNVLLAKEYVDVLPVSRPLIIECLEEKSPVGVIVEYKTVSGIVAGEGWRPVVKFVDGGEEVADLVVGADGVGSLVRRGLFDGGEEKYKPEYLGTCAIGAVLETPLPQHLVDDPCLMFFMGPAGHFGYAGLTQRDRNKLLWWSIWHTPLPEHGQKPDVDALVTGLHQRHDDWADPIIAKCLHESKPENIYPIFVMPELPHWGRDGVVLVGDAAHAIPPSTGQGSSQAFEDALTFALILAGHLERQPNTGADEHLNEAISKSISGFFAVRHERVYKLRARGLAWKDPELPMPWWKMWMFYVALAVFVRVKWLMSFFDGGVVNWDVKGNVEKYFEGVDWESDNARKER